MEDVEAHGCADGAQSATPADLSHANTRCADSGDSKWAENGGIGKNMATLILQWHGMQWNYSPSLVVIECGLGGLAGGLSGSTTTGATGAPAVTTTTAASG
ncbi:hypothetical protein PRIPAC_70422 [Pristionchus pacificus]|uniref:Uncharacterized protein n=2 Tax=Pristionchus pacificus TaxID=54126 RepID=A0A2A6BDE9_PRIPA|nr:hypothetical protein PRIPAC_70422 [Pristionchus pacificus]|eukprot:PDM63930.1 hypothetical protein PRIPAC_53904 [Pristionchus pacificus]